MSPRPHTCHARCCTEEVPPKLLMCRHHWFMVPRSLRTKVNAGYRPGQCDARNPSREWLKAAKEAIRAVAAKELQ